MSQTQGVAATLQRRGFLLAGMAAGGGLLVGCGAPAPQSRLGTAAQFNPEGDQIGLNGWVKISPDGVVSVAVPRAEMGQGVHTALAMLVAEELDADWALVRAEAAPVARIYANPALMLNVVPFLSDDDGLVARLARASMQRLGYWLSLQVTGGSSSVRDAWEPMRLAGASARAMLVQAAAEQWAVPPGSCSVAKGRVSHAASRRQASFGALASAAAKLAPPSEVALKSPKAFKLIGTAVPRLDIPAKTTGAAQFGIDVRPPGLLYAAIRQCPVFGGSLRGFNAGAARSARGIKDVFGLGNTAVVVLADSYWRAKTALAGVEIDWDEGAHAALDSAAISSNLRRALDESSGTGFRSQGDAAAVLAGAAQRIEAEYEVPFLAHAALEPVNCTAQFKDGKLSLWCATQVPSLARWKAAQAAGISTDAVTLHLPYLGGGFGRRLETDMVEQAVAIALRSQGAPVKLVWSREEDMQHDMYRPAAVARFTAALDASGAPLAWLNKVAAPSIGLGTMSRLLPALAMDMPDKNQIEGAFDLAYAVPNLSVRQLRVATPVPVGSWRSVGHSYNAFFTECFIDELAQSAKQDAVAYRRRLLDAHPRHQAVLDLAAKQAGWGSALPAGRARGVALHESFAAICAQVAEVSVDDGQARVHRIVCAIDCGSVVNPDTVAAQVHSAIVFGLTAALYGEISIAKGRVVQSNFGDYRLLGLAAMPQIDVHIVASALPPGGVGEPATPPVAPAVANALAALTGQRLRRLPLRLVG